MVNTLVKLSWLASILTSVMAPASAQIATDGTLPGTVAESLGGPDYLITPTNGLTVGSNLFHSFTTFNILRGESATFTGAVGLDNVVSRVTGGSASVIDGLLRSEVVGADFYFLNPGGVMFGAHAAVDVPGSFHVSTGDYVRLGDGTRFNALPSAADNILTTAAPEAFGFLGDNPAEIVFEGSGSGFAQFFAPQLDFFSGLPGLDKGISVPEGETLSIVGGDIRIRNGILDAGFFGVLFGLTEVGVETFVRAPAGQINLVSAAGPGEVGIANGEAPAVTLESFGDIEISGQSIFGEPSSVDVSGDGSGRVNVLGANVELEGGFIFADNFGNLDAEGVGVQITAQESLALRNNAGVRVDVFAGGDAGDISISAGQVNIENDSFIGTRANLGTTGNPGNITLDVESLEIRNGSEVTASTFGAGGAGAVEITAQHIFLSADGSVFFTGIGSQANDGTGDAGGIVLNVESLEVHNEAEVSSNTFADGDGGDIVVNAETVRLSGNNGISLTGIGASSQPGSTGLGGSITLTATDLRILDGAVVIVSALGSGNGGELSIRSADGVVSIEKGGQVAGNTFGAGDGGDVLVEARELIIDGGKVEAKTAGAGGGGTVSIDTHQSVRLDNQAAITVSSTGTGFAGDISINAGEEFRMSGGSTVSSEALQSDGGNIEINASDLVLIDGSVVSTKVAGGAGAGGNISIDPSFVILFNGRIIADAFGGPGGNITIVTDNFFADGSSLLSASSSQSIDGVIEIASPDTDVSGQLLVLEGKFVDPASQLAKQCATRGGQVKATFVRETRDGIGQRPSESLFSRYMVATPVSDATHS